MIETQAAARLQAFRDELARRGLHGFILPRNDEFLGEEAPAANERLAWLTGFTGSEGTALVLAETAAVASDGRYVLQLAAQTDPALWQRLHQIETPPPGWIAAHAPAGAAIGFDPRLMSEEAVGRYEAAGLRLVPVEDNPVDRIWHDRPPLPAAPARPHPMAFAGESSAAKRTRLAEELRGDAAVVVSDPASVAWLLNLRGEDLGFTPVVQAVALLHADATVDLFLDPSRVPETLRQDFGNGVRVQPPSALAAALQGFGGRRVRVDPSGTSAWFGRTLRAAGAELHAAPDPCLLARAVKNPVEQEAARAAHRADGRALCRFLHWIDGRAGETEMSAVARLIAFRREEPGFRGESFPAISGAGPNGAIMHYRVTPATDRAIGRDEVYLIDSGGQYDGGTTDVTRTVWTGPSPAPAVLRDRYTRVLRGHVALAMQRFPPGTPGARLDTIARAPLWQAGLDYDHGTGHGVGSHLSVHEGPARLSHRQGGHPIAPGMILSDEPGYYEPGAFGMRIENLLLVRQGEVGSPGFLEFETLTLAPYDRALIEPGLLTPDERGWIDAYHARVRAEIGPTLDGADGEWLARACATLEER
jgi:Xaa-Pro aminopeptidase